MPGYKASLICSTLTPDHPAVPATTEAVNSVDPVIAPLLASIMIVRSVGHEYCLQTVPVVTEYLSTEEHQPLQYVSLYNQKIPVFTGNYCVVVCGMWI